MRDPVLGFIYLSKIHIFLPNNVRYTLYKSTLIYLATTIVIMHISGMESSIELNIIATLLIFVGKL